MSWNARTRRPGLDTGILRPHRYHDHDKAKSQTSFTNPISNQRVINYSSDKTTPDDESTPLSQTPLTNAISSQTVLEVETQTPKVISLKFLIDTRAKRVLFAEVGDEFVDFLFNIFSLHVASVVKLLTKENLVGSLGKLYNSLENLDDNYMKPIKKESFLLPEKSNTSGTQFFSFLADMSNASSKGLEKSWYLKGVMKYLVMDDLVVQPMPTLSYITTLLHSLGVNEIDVLEEKVVHFNVDNEGVKLLKESLQSKTVLTNVFLPRKTPKDAPKKTTINVPKKTPKNIRWLRI